MTSKFKWWKRTKSNLTVQWNAVQCNSGQQTANICSWFPMMKDALWICWRVGQESVFNWEHGWSHMMDLLLTFSSELWTLKHCHTTSSISFLFQVLFLFFFMLLIIVDDFWFKCEWSGTSTLVKEEAVQLPQNVPQLCLFLSPLMAQLSEQSKSHNLLSSNQCCSIWLWAGSGHCILSSKQLYCTV